MANVFTRRNKCPKTVYLSDFSCHETKKRVNLPRIQSATRMGNPHPEGLRYQALNSDEKVSIWNPNFYKYAQRLTAMLEHTGKVNFTCGKFKMAPKILGKPPDIQYTENTISRVSFRDPARFKCLNFKLNTTRYGYTPTQVIAKGIVPDLTPPAYRIPQ